MNEKKNQPFLLKLWVNFFNLFFINIFKNKTPKLPEFLFLVGTAFFPQMNVELIIRFKNNNTLYIWRDDLFGNKGWHLPGGIIRPNETIDKRIEKVLIEETQINPENINIYGPISFSEVIYSEPRIRSHFNSLVYLLEMDSRFINLKDFKDNKEVLITKDIPVGLINNHKRYIHLLKKDNDTLKTDKFNISPPI